MYNGYMSICKSFIHQICYQLSHKIITNVFGLPRMYQTANCPYLHS